MLAAACALAAGDQLRLYVQVKPLLQLHPLQRLLQDQELMLHCGCCSHREAEAPASAAIAAALAPETAASASAAVAESNAAGDQLQH